VIATQRDAGLLRAVGPWALAASIVNIVVGAGIFAVPGPVAASVGPYGPLVFLVCAVAIGSVAICFAEGGSRVPTSGGPYGYIEAAFGPLSGYVTGTLLWFSDVLACGGIAAALADVAVDALSPPPPLKVPVHAAVIVLVVGGIAFVNVGGVARGARFVNALTALKLVPFVVFIAVGAFAVHPTRFAASAELDTTGVGRATILALFAFTGMESSLCASGEVKDPARTIPRAIAMALVCVTVLYVGIQVVSQGILGAALATSKTPLADAMAQVSPALKLLMLVGAALSMFGWIGSDLLGTPRILFAFAREGWLPRSVGAVHPRTHAPHVAIFSYAALAIAIALTGSFTELAVLATLAIAPLYMAGCAAAWTLARRGVALAGAPLGFRWLSAAAVAGITSMLLMLALAARAELLGLVALLGVSVMAYLVVSRRAARA
jgi:amino acid transporter